MVCHGFSLLDQVRRQEGLHEHLQDTWHMSIMFFLWMPLRRAILWGWNHQIPMGFDCGSSLCLICDMLVSIFGAAIS